MILCHVAFDSAFLRLLCRESDEGTVLNTSTSEDKYGTVVSVLRWWEQCNGLFKELHSNIHDALIVGEVGVNMMRNAAGAWLIFVGLAGFLWQRRQVSRLDPPQRRDAKLTCSFPTMCWLCMTSHIYQEHPDPRR
jgi:uncharacterized iron-regulated membrane protein